MGTSQIKALFEDHDGFVAKFKPKKTTDDCYTPQPVYDEVLRFVGELTDLTGREIVRPFYPGGDFERYDYPDNCVVIDNPPFSIYSKIVRFYLSHRIDFFLFAPALTQIVVGAEVCYVVCMATVTYENGAVVRTSFTTNLVPGTRMMVCGSLTKRLEEVQKKKSKSVFKYAFSDNIVTPAQMGKVSAQGVDFSVPSDACCYINTLDNMPKCKTLFGRGLLLSDSAAAEKTAAERMAAERMAAERAAVEARAIVVPLSQRERELVTILNKKETRP